MNNPLPPDPSLPTDTPPPPLPLTPEQKAQQLAEVASFLVGVKGSLTELKSKAIDGSSIRDVDNLNLTKLAQELDRANNNIRPAVGAPVVVEQKVVPVVNVPNVDTDPNQLTFQFDKKHSLDDIFNKIDDTYRKVISLEEEVHKIKNLLEEKKSIL